MSRKQNKKKLLPAVMSSLILWVMSIVLSTMMATIGVPIIANANDLSIFGSSIQSQILSVEDAILQNYSIEDLKATQSFLIVKPYEGSGRVLDVNDDGRVNVFDLCLMKRNYKTTGNYNVLLTEMINSVGVTNSTMNADGTETTNRVAVRTTIEYDFTEYHPIAVLSNNENKYLLQFDSYEAADTCVNSLQGSQK